MGLNNKPVTRTVDEVDGALISVETSIDEEKIRVSNERPQSRNRPPSKTVTNK